MLFGEMVTALRNHDLGVIFGNFQNDDHNSCALTAILEKFDKVFFFFQQQRFRFSQLPQFQ